MEQALRQAAILTFEELGFMFPSTEFDHEMEMEQTVAVEVGFHGNFGGKIVLCVEKKMLPTLAANMLGEDECEITEEIQRDVLGEFANVICGNTLPAIAGKKAVFRLNPPQITEIDIEKNPSALTKLNSDEGRADILLFVDEQ